MKEKFGIGLKFYHVAGAIITALGLVTALFVYWSIRPYQAIKISNVHVDTEHVVGGQIIVYEVSYCKAPQFRRMRAVEILTLTDHIIYNIPPTVLELGVGCQTVSEFMVMPKVPSGLFTLKVDYVYAPNPVRRVIASGTSQAFIVNDK